MGEEHQDTDVDGVTGDIRRVEAELTHLWYLAVAAVALTLGCIVLATQVSPSFAWREHALSNLGVTWTDPGTTTTVLLFNGGLITGGLVGITVALLLYRWIPRRGDRVVLLLAATALALMGLVGVFPQGTTAHFPVAIGFFLLISATLWVEGLLQYRRGERRWGGLSVAGGTANILAWVVWFAAVETPSEGLAVPEMVGAVIFGVWLLVLAMRLSS